MARRRMLGNVSWDRAARAASALVLAAGMIGGTGCAEPPRSTASRPPKARATSTPRAPAESVATPTAPTTPRAPTVSAAPGRLPSVAGGIPVVVRASAAPRTPAPTAAARSDREGRNAVRGASPPRFFDATVAARPGSRAGATAPATDQGEAEIRAMLGDYLAAFNRHDPAALAAHWTSGGRSVDLVSGDVTSGREAVADVFDALFRAEDGASIDIDVESIRLVRDDVAVVDAVSRLEFNAGQGPAAAASRLSAVVTREAAGWKIASLHETPLSAAAARPAPARSLEALEWLVGTWEDAGDGVTAHTRCFWSTGHAFLIRCHTVSYDAPAAGRAVDDADGIPHLLPPGHATDREVTEIIGWDPASASIRSWVFTSEGRFAEGTWARHGDRWLVTMRGAGADSGNSCSATLERIGTDELAFRCTGDSLADALPPACDFTRTAADATAP